MFLSGIIAFLVNLSIYWIIGNTSPVTYPFRVRAVEFLSFTTRRRSDLNISALLKLMTSFKNPAIYTFFSFVFHLLQVFGFYCLLILPLHLEFFLSSFFPFSFIPSIKQFFFFTFSLIPFFIFTLSPPPSLASLLHLTLF